MPAASAAPPRPTTAVSSTPPRGATAPSKAVVFGSTANSRVAICKDDHSGQYQYRGVRVSDGAKLILPPKSTDGGLRRRERRDHLHRDVESAGRQGGRPADPQRADGRLPRKVPGTRLARSPDDLGDRPRTSSAAPTPQPSAAPVDADSDPAAATATRGGRRRASPASPSRRSACGCRSSPCTCCSACTAIDRVRVRRRP